MKILHILESSLPCLVGYTIRSKYILDYQRQQGCKVAVVTSPFMNHPEPGKILQEEMDGVNYYRTHPFNSLKDTDSQLLRYFKRYRLSRIYENVIIEVCAKEKPDLLHAHSSYFNGYSAARVGKRLNIPVVYEVRGLWGETALVTAGIGRNSFKYRMNWYLDLKAMNNADRIIAISQGIKEELVQRGITEAKIDIVPNGVDITNFQPLARESAIAAKVGLVEDDFVLGYIGSIRRIEGLHLLIDAMAILTKEIPHLKLLIVGEGDDRPRLEKEAHKAGLDGKVIFTGRVLHTDVQKYYSLINLFVLPRVNALVNQRVTPLKPLEIMAMGKAVLGSDVGGIKEIVVPGENGFLFRADDVDDLVQQIRNIKSSPSLLIETGVKARNWVQANRDWSRIVPLYQPIYGKLIPSKVGG